MKLYDNHVHTHFAYCSDDDMYPEFAVQAAAQKGCGMSLIEHAAHLYTTRAAYVSDGFIENSELMYDCDNDRMEEYIKYIQKFRGEDVKIGMEAEIFADGKLSLKPEHKDSWDIVLGAVHFLPKMYENDLEKGVLWAAQAMAQGGADVYAHPFRIFRRHDMQVPRRIYKPIVQLLRDGAVAAELNFHYNEPDIEFFEMCLEHGIKISLGSDAHQRFEVCDLAPHVQMLTKLCGEDFSDVLFVPGERA